MRTGADLLRSASMLLLAVAPSGIAAQELSGPPPGASRIGPVFAVPRIAVRNFGVDGNVFNEPDDPKSDTTLSVMPEAEFWMRLGRGSISGTSRGWGVYYHEYADQRSFNLSQDARVEVPFNRFRPRVFASYLNTRDRPGPEIDVRARRLTSIVEIGTDMRTLTKTIVRLEAIRRRTAFDEGAVFDGTNLREALTHTGEGLRASLRHTATPLTTGVVIAEIAQDRFDFQPERNARTFSILAGAEFARTALISGSALVGYRRFTPVPSGPPPYSGLAVNLEVAYVLRGVTRFSVNHHRDVTYSYDFQHPYFLQTGVSLSVTQRIRERWDVVGSAAVDRMDYRRRPGAAPGLLPGEAGAVPLDGSRGYGAGMGYRIGRSTRIGLDVAYESRESQSATRNFVAWQVGSSVTYGY